MKAQVDPSSVSEGSKTGDANLRKVRKGKSKASSKQCRNKLGKAKSQEPEESMDVKAYLDKLQEMVPFMPKNKKLSKLEVITHAIDYIRDLRDTLGLPQCDDDDASDDDFDADVSLDSFGTDLNDFIPTPPVDYVTDPSTMLIANNNYSGNMNSAKLSLSVSTTSPPTPSPNENFMNLESEEIHHHHINNNSGRQPFCAIANLNGSLSETSNPALEESSKLKQISCRL